MMPDREKLTGRRLQIATTGGGLTPGQIATARASYLARGFDVPAWTGPPLPAVPAPATQKPRSKTDRRGVGTILKEIFLRWGIASLGCSCDNLAREMDAEGPHWCRRNLQRLTAEIEEHAQQRDWLKLLPFKKFAIRRLIRRAIRVHAAEQAGDHARNQSPDEALGDTDDDPPPANEPPVADVGFRVGDYRSSCAVYNRDGRTVALQGLYRGSSAFLLCGGPSLAQVDPDLLQRRGVLTMAVNNAAAVFRPHLWCYVDSPSKWIEQVWLDPSVLKFVPLRHMSQHPRVQDRAGRLIDAPETIGELPGVFGYRRNAEFRADRWLTEPSFSWGCANDIADDVGVTGTRTVFLVALKLLCFLGVHTIYLVGCDWRMDAAQPYAFGQQKDADAVQRNNNLYRVTAQRLSRLRPHLERAGVRVVNATPGSRLDVFPRLSLQEAVQAATSRLPAKIITEGRY